MVTKAKRVRTIVNVQIERNVVDRLLTEARKRGQVVTTAPARRLVEYAIHAYLTQGAASNGA